MINLKQCTKNLRCKFINYNFKKIVHQQTTQTHQLNWLCWKIQHWNNRFLTFIIVLMRLIIKRWYLCRKRQYLKLLKVEYRINWIIVEKGKEIWKDGYKQWEPDWLLKLIWLLNLILKIKILLINYRELIKLSIIKKDSLTSWNKDTIIYTMNWQKKMRKMFFLSITLSWQS